MIAVGRRASLREPLAEPPSPAETTASPRVVRGRVIEKRARLPVSGAVITSSADAHGASTDAEGRFEIELSDPDVSSVLVEAPRFSAIAFDARGVDEASGAPFEVPLDYASTLRATLLGVDRSPLTGAELRVEGSIPRLPGSQRDPADAFVRSAQADEDGLAVIEGLPAYAPLRCSVWHRGRSLFRVSDPIELGPGEQRPTTWSMGVEGVIRGVVRERDGRGVPDCVVWLQRATADGLTLFGAEDESGSRRSARSDQEGRFRFADVPRGSWWLGPAHLPDTDPHVIAPASIGQRIDLPAEDVEREVRLLRGLVVIGRVLAPDGSTPARAEVDASHGPNQGYCDAVPIVDGWFAIGPLAPGRWSLRAKGLTPISSRSDAAEVEAGATDVVLQLNELGTVRVRVIDAAGVPVEEARIVAGSRAWRSHTRTRVDGICVLEGVPPGPLTVGATTEDGRWAVFSGRDVGHSTTVVVDLALVPGVRARIRARPGSRASGFEVFRDGVLIASVPAASQEGIAHVTMPIGSCELRAFTMAGFVTGSVEVSADTTPEFTFDGEWR